ncbi:MAG: SOS response-associated peptidase [Planctomycetes bacterium]|nr:SOS response-associated peptidase [Planctomycetota bacterium]
MPGRLIQDPEDLAAHLAHFGVKATAALIKKWEPLYNLAPNNDALCVRQRGNRREAVMLRWGLVPYWEKDSATAKKPINARSETADQLKTFREAFRKRRCIVAATGWYEWTPGKLRKQPHCIRPAHGLPLGFAGLYENWDSGVGVTIDSLTVLTCEPNTKMAQLHHRMGCILDPAHYDAWLDPKNEDVDALKDMLRPCPNEWLTHHTVSNIVSDQRNKGASCIKPGKIAARWA